MAKLKTVEVVDKNYERIESIIRSYGGTPDSLISILQDVQSNYHYLPEHALRLVAKGLGLPLIQVYGVVTFFKALSLTPRGRHIVNVCLGTACHVRGAPTVLDELERQLGVKSGETTEDQQFTLETVNCLGACALGPILVVDGKYHGQMNAAKVKKVLKPYKEVPEPVEDEEVKIAG